MKYRDILVKYHQDQKLDIGKRHPLSNDTGDDGEYRISKRRKRIK